MTISDGRLNGSVKWHTVSLWFAAFGHSLESSGAIYSLRRLSHASGACWFNGVQWLNFNRLLLRCIITTLCCRLVMATLLSLCRLVAFGLIWTFPLNFLCPRWDPQSENDVLGWNSFLTKLKRTFSGNHILRRVPMDFLRKLSWRAMSA